jgi:hypothetical protein
LASDAGSGSTETKEKKLMKLLVLFCFVAILGSNGDSSFTNPFYFSDQFPFVLNPAPTPDNGAVNPGRLVNTSLLPESMCDQQFGNAFLPGGDCNNTSIRLLFLQTPLNARSVGAFFSTKQDLALGFESSFRYFFSVSNVQNATAFNNPNVFGFSFVIQPVSNSFTSSENFGVGTTSPAVGLVTSWDFPRNCRIFTC